MNESTISPVLKLPPGFDEYTDPARRPQCVSGGQLVKWIEFWWGGTTGSSYLNTLVKTGQLVVEPSPFKHKRMFDTEKVFRWALENGAGRRR
jgi:hypothetical protein